MITDSIVYLSKTGQSFKTVMLAANLVSEHGTAGLPAPRGKFKFLELDPGVHKFPPHQIQKLYPGVKIVRLASVVERQFAVERNGVRGVSLYLDHNGSGLSLSVGSAMGRNFLAPISWKAGSDTPDPTATVELECRPVVENGQRVLWQNHMIHGWSGIHGADFRYDWLDGAPVNVTNMHDRLLGNVQQWIAVPNYQLGLGIAEQTIGEEDLTKTIAFAVWFPQSEFVTHMQNFGRSQVSDYDRIRNLGAIQPTGGDYFKGDSGYESIRSIGSEGVVKASRPTLSVTEEFKLAVGGTIRQHIIRNPFGPGLWQPEPEVLILVSLVNEEQWELLQSQPGGIRRF